MADPLRSYLNRITLLMLAIMVLTALPSRAAAQGLRLPWNDPAHFGQMLFQARQRQAQEEQRKKAEAEALRQQRQAQISFYEQLARESRINVPSFRVLDFILWQRLNADLRSRFYPTQTHFPLLSGGTFEVPWGSYNGSGLVRLEALKRSQTGGRDGIPVHMWLALAHPSGGSLSYPAGPALGWRFEPAGMLQGELRVVQTGDAPAPNMCTPGVYCEPPPPNTRPCLFAIQYRYVGPGGVLTFLPEGDENVFSLPATIPVAEQGSESMSCLMRLDESYRQSKVPTKLRSTSGAVILDLSDRSRPMMRYPDGSMEVLGKGEESAGWVSPAQFEEIFAPPAARPSTITSMIIFDRMFTARFIDANGNVQQYRSKLEPAYLTIGDQKWPLEYPIARETMVEDSQGRVTRYIRDEQGDVTEIRSPGPFGRSDLEKVFTLRWEQIEWDPTRVMPDVQCRFRDPIYDWLDFDPSSFDPCPRLTYKTLVEMSLPDGTKYAFSYDLPEGQKSWGALTGATAPGGAIHRFTYGDARTFSQWPASLPVYGGGFEGRDMVANREIAYTFFANELNKRRLVSATVFPSGPQGPSTTTKIQHDESVTRLPGDFRSRGPDQCSHIAWTRTLHLERDGANEAVRQTLLRGDCVQDPPAFNDRAASQTIAAETIDEAGRLIEGSYFGNTGRLPMPDSSGSGQMFMQAETAALSLVRTPVLTPLDSRPTQVIRYRDGLAWKEVFEYDRNGPLVNGVKRTHGNMIKKQVVDEKGVVQETQNDYVTQEDYLKRNLVRLPKETRVYGLSDGVWKLLSRAGVSYDDEILIPSNDDRLDRTLVSAYRGNATRGTVYRVEASDGRADDGVPESITMRTRYYDNGVVYEEKKELSPGRFAVTTNLGDFRSCTAADPIRQTVVISPDPGNGSGQHQTLIRKDCFSGLTLSVLDPNSNRSCTQYDRLGRVLETAVPGDRLSSIPEGIRDPVCFTSGVSELGSNGAGPTTWTVYKYLGKMGQSVGGSDGVHQHAITWAKNGVGGTYVKTFSDGLGRAIQVCDQVDPSTNQGNQEVCTHKQYDDSGKTDTEYLPFYNGGTSDSVTLPPPGLQYHLTKLDPLGRPVETRLVGSGVPPTVSCYASDGRAWISKVIAPKGYREGLDCLQATEHATVTVTNLLGHMVQVSRENSSCEGGWCTTVKFVDGLGRPLAIQGPKNADGTGGYAILVDYDGLGRKKAMKDPSLTPSSCKEGETCRGQETYKYDLAGNPVEKTDNKGRTTVYEYDGLGRLVKKTLPVMDGDRPEERQVSYTYDVSTISTGSQQTTRTGDGTRGMLSARDVRGRGIEGGPNPAVKGMLTAVANGFMRRALAYDALGRVVTEAATLEDKRYTQSTRYGYPRGENVAGPGSVLVSQTRPDGEVVETGYDADGKLLSLSTRPARGNSQPVLSGVKWNVHGDITEATLGNGTVTRYAYDQNRSWRLSGKKVLRGTQPLLDLAFKWDFNGNLEELANLTPERGWVSWKYGYDSLDQLTRAMTAGDTLELTYDYAGTGNLLTKSMIFYDDAEKKWSKNTYNQRYGESGASPHAVTASGPHTFTYDGMGNLLSTTIQGGLEFRWNAENMPFLTKRGGRAVAEKWFLGEAMWKKVETQAETNEVTTTYLPFPGVRVENGNFRHTFGDWAERDPKDGKLRFYHRDQVGSSVLITDEQGSVVYEALYQPYGEDWMVLTKNHDPLKRFSNQEQERSSGLYDFGARLYLPQTGRWISADSVLDGLNRYAYVGNNPLRYVDPTGHDGHPVMSSPNSDYAKWRAEMLKRFGSEVGQSVIEGVSAIDAAVKNHESILFLAQGIKNPKASDDENQMTWQNHAKVTTVAMVNSNGLADAAHARSNHDSAKALAYLINYALGQGVKASDMVLGTHSNGANVLDETLGIMKRTYGRSLSGSTALIMAPNASVSTIYSIARQVGNSQVAVFDALADKPLLAAGRGASIDYNHISRSTRPGNVHFYRVDLPWYGWNHPVGNYFKAIEKGNYREYKP